MKNLSIEDVWGHIIHEEIPKSIAHDLVKVMYEYANGTSIILTKELWWIKHCGRGIPKKLGRPTKVTIPEWFREIESLLKYYNYTMHPITREIVFYSDEPCEGLWGRKIGRYTGE